MICGRRSGNSWNLFSLSCSACSARLREEMSVIRLMDAELFKVDQVPAHENRDTAAIPPDEIQFVGLKSFPGHPVPDGNSDHLPGIQEGQGA